MTKLHEDAEAFVLCAMADETNSYEQYQEIGTFLLSLILAHKKGLIESARKEREGAS